MEPVYTEHENKALEYGSILLDHQLRKKFFHEHFAATGEQCFACDFLKTQPELVKVLERLDELTPKDSPLRSTPRGN